MQAGRFLGSEYVWATLPEEEGATAAGNLRERHRRVHSSTRRLQRATRHEKGLPLWKDYGLDTSLVPLFSAKSKYHLGEFGKTACGKQQRQALALLRAEKAPPPREDFQAGGSRGGQGRTQQDRGVPADWRSSGTARSVLPRGPQHPRADRSLATAPASPRPARERPRPNWLRSETAAAPYTCHHTPFKLLPKDIGLGTGTAPRSGASRGTGRLHCRSLVRARPPNKAQRNTPQAQPPATHARA